MRQSFIGNMWSETAAILGYSGAGQKVALPALVKTLEMSRPYECMATIFLLMLLYTLLMVFVMLLFNLKKGQLDVLGSYGKIHHKLRANDNYISGLRTGSHM